MNAAERRIRKRIVNQRDKFVAKLVMLGFKYDTDNSTYQEFIISNERNDYILIRVAPTSGSVYIYINKELIGGTWTQTPALEKIIEVLSDPKPMSSHA